jgi:cytidylate kinase
MAHQRTPGIEHLIERQAARWAVAQRASTAEAPPVPRPCVAISRLPYAGGLEVAERVAATLDYGVFAGNIVEEIVTEHGGARALGADLDERARNAIERLVADLFRSHVPTEDERIRQVVQLVATIGQRGAAVVVGRGAAYLLGPERALRVLAVAPAAERAARLRATRGMDPTAAREELAREDRGRAEFVRRHFGVDQSDPTRYDLVVNTATLGIGGAVAAILAAFADRFPTARRRA